MSRPVLSTSRIRLEPMTSERLGMRHVRTEHRQWDEPLPGAEHGEVIYEISRDVWAGTRYVRAEAARR